MVERIPLTKAEQLDQLDQAEVIQGYWDGKDGDPEPGDNHSLSYWHGWRNGAVDGKHRVADNAQRQLAHDVVETGYLRKKP